jgi:phosphomevalonate kinase
VTSGRIASAPGKIVLCGEYAVLDGAPAICMAVNRRARAFLTDIGGGTSEVTAASLTEAIGRFRIAEGGIEWESGQEFFEIIDSIWRAPGFKRDGAQSIDLDTADFIDAQTGRKIGIGSSAAITVALCTAIRGSGSDSSMAEFARWAHQELQGGAGSGVDIACSLNGGLIEYRMEGSTVAQLKWPEELSYRVIWTGVPASTKGKLAKLASMNREPSRTSLAGASESMATAWQSGDAGEIVEQYRVYNECLWRFSIDHDLGVFDAGHKEIHRNARSLNLIYKPCGAGGGDIGILLGTDESVLDRFTRKLAAKYSVLDCQLTALGASIETSRAKQ